MNNHPCQKVPVFITRRTFFFWVLLISLLLIGCAGQVQPGGGPIDTVPPIIVKTVPDTNSTRVQTDKLELEFSKYVDHQSVEQSIFISPNLGELEFDWSGKSVKVNFSQPLRTNTTYVINIGTDVIDLRQPPNRMASGFALAFSTGDSIDRSSVGGRVFDEKPEGVMIFAYKLKNVNPDTLDPGRVKPDFVTQTGKEGTFTVSHVPPGAYRVIAVRDEYRNLLYDKEVDQYGVPGGDIMIAPPAGDVAGVWIRMSREDTTKPFVTSAAATNSRQVLIRFSEPIDSLSFGHGVFSINDTLTRREIPVIVSYLDRSNPAISGVVTRRSLDSAAVYVVRAAGLADRAGNPIDTGHAAYVFQGSGRPDSARPSIAVQSFADSAQGVSPEEPVEIHFSKPVEQDPLRHAIEISDTARHRFSADVAWHNATALSASASIPLRDNTWYSLRVVMDSVRDFSGNRYKDSVLTVRFKTLDYRSTGTIEGTVEDTNARIGVVRLAATSTDAPPVYARTVVLKGPGKFSIDHLREGKYLLSGYIDADSSGNYSYGRPFPFLPSERFANYPDTIKVRARWGVEGIVLKFR